MRGFITTPPRDWRQFGSSRERGRRRRFSHQEAPGRLENEGWWGAAYAPSRRSCRCAAGGIQLRSIARADELFKARLTADQEVQVPPVQTDTTAQFEILVNKDATAGEYTLRVNNGVRLTSLTSTVVRPGSMAR